MVNVLPSSAVDRGSNIGGVMVSVEGSTLTITPPMFDPRSTALEGSTLTITPPMFDPRSTALHWWCNG
jgi:hypothetical protein